ncbi:MAG: hypothetical protein ABI386_04475 [Rhodanobacter sp.]
MFAVSSAMLRKCLLAVPALGLFGPLVMVIGLRDPSIFSYAIALFGALATGTAIAILGGAVVRFLPAAKEG